MLKSFRILTLLIIFASLISCSDDSDIKEAISSRLKDPGSVRFGEISIVKMQDNYFEGKGIEIACVTFNAKNSFGGYAGEHQALVVKTANGWEMDKDPSEVSHKDCVERLRHRAIKAKGELEPITVALADQGATRYLQLSIVVILNDEANWQVFNQFEPKIQTAIFLYLAGQKSSMLTTDYDKQRLAEGIRQEIDSVFKSQTKYMVKEVIIKSFNLF